MGIDNDNENHSQFGRELGMRIENENHSQD